MTYPHFIKLFMIKNQCIIGKKLFRQRITFIFKLHLINCIRVCCRFRFDPPDVLQRLLSREFQDIICLLLFRFRKTDRRMSPDAEIHRLICRILYFPFYIQSVLFQRIRHIQLKCVREHFLCLLGILQHISY